MNLNERQEAEVVKELALRIVQGLLPKKESPTSKLTYFTDLNDEEKLLSSVVIQGTDIVESLRDFVDCVEEVDSYMSSFEEMVGDVSIESKNKIINSIIADTLTVGGFGYDLRVKSLEG